MQMTMQLEIPSLINDLKDILVFVLISIKRFRYGILSFIHGLINIEFNTHLVHWEILITKIGKLLTIYTFA